MDYKKHKEKAPKCVRCAVLVISDSRTESTDESGKLIKEKLHEKGHRVSFYTILRNEAEAIKEIVEELLVEDRIQVIITSGGTGASHKDITVETITPLLDKKLDGLGELFRFLTYQEIGTGSIMSRAMGGVAKGKIVLCFPGSLAATKLAMEQIILPELGHLVREAIR